jgi:hypothetical protein
MTHQIRRGSGNSFLLAMFILDVLRYDIEAVPSIVNLLNNRGSIGWRNFWAYDFTEKEVTSALETLLQRGLVKPLRYDETLKELVAVQEVESIRGNIDSLWFMLTERGRQAWEKWEPPVEEANNGQ